MTTDAEILIIGGGLVGLATAMHLQKMRPRSKVLVLEKRSMISDQQSGNNSGVLHAGIYYEPGSLKAKLCVLGNQALSNLCQRLDGETDADNVELRRVGTPRSFDFDARSHIEIGEGQGWLDIVRGAQLAGSRNYVLRGDLSLLEHAVMRFAFDTMIAKGFVPLSVPTLVRRETMVGTGYFPGGEDQAYRTDERDDLCLVGTAEVPVTALHQGEILDGAELPLRFVALSTCYRREAGTYGKDTKGLYRVH